MSVKGFKKLNKLGFKMCTSKHTYKEIRGKKESNPCLSFEHKKYWLFIYFTKDGGYFELFEKFNWPSTTIERVRDVDPRIKKAVELFLN